MARDRVDGKKFEEEVKKGLDSILIPNFQVRLHTNKVSSISDFIIFSKDTIILETKETAEKAFSLNTMQQRELAEKFQEFYEIAEQRWGKRPYRMVILVHFIKHKLYMWYDFTEKLAILHASDTIYDTSTDLKDALTRILLSEGENSNGD